MKVSIRVGMRSDNSDNPLDSALKECKELGYDGIELMLSPNHPYKITLPWSNTGKWQSRGVTPEMRANMLESSKKHGVEVATVSSDWAWGYAHFGSSLSEWGLGVELLKADVNLGADLGAKAMLMHVGEASGSWDEIKNIVKQVVAEGEKRQLKVGFEAGIFARTGLGGLPELIKLVDEINSPWFGIYEHCYWPRGEMQPHEEIALVGKRIVCVHSFLPTVQVDYQKMLKALKDVGYDWYWVYETPWNQAAQAIADFRHLQKQYGA